MNQAEFSPLFPQGYIVDLFDGSAWLTLDGRVTDLWEERGIWATLEAAGEAMQRSLNGKPKPKNN